MGLISPAFHLKTPAFRATFVVKTPPEVHKLASAVMMAMMMNMVGDDGDGDGDGDGDACDDGDDGDGEGDGDDESHDKYQDAREIEVAVRAMVLRWNMSG